MKNEQYIYLINCKFNSTFFDGKKLNELLELLVPSEKRYINSFVFKEDIYRSLISRVLCKLFLSKVLNLSPRCLRLKYSISKRPYLYKGQNFDFNWSHSGSQVLFGFSLSTHIGVDIEFIKEEYIDSLGNLFTDSDLYSIPYGNKVVKTLSLWTMKEAYGKATGEGINENVLKKKMTLSTKNAYEYTWGLDGMYLSSFINKEYVISLCSNKPISNLRIIDITIDDLYKWYIRSCERWANQIG